MFWSRHSAPLAVQVGSPSRPREIPIAVHPSKQSGVIVINYPGFMGDIDGFNDKYKKLADFMSGPCAIGTVVRMGNERDPSCNYSESVVDDLASVIRFCSERSTKLCRASTPRIFLVGFSAGASAIAALASEFPSVEKILLVAPSGDAGARRIKESLPKYTGELYAVVGSHDEVVGAGAAEMFSSLAQRATVNRYYVVPDCDHQFRGETNGYIMSALPNWAFSLHGKGQPCQESGIRLY